MQGLRCKHGAAVLARRLRLVVEGQLPASAGVVEKKKRGEGGGEEEWEGEVFEQVPAEAEVLTQEEWFDLARVNISSFFQCISLLVARVFS